MTSHKIDKPRFLDNSRKKQGRHDGFIRHSKINPNKNIDADPLTVLFFISLIAGAYAADVYHNAQSNHQSKALLNDKQSEMLIKICRRTPALKTFNKPSFLLLLYNHLIFD